MCRLARLLLLIPALACSGGLPTAVTLDDGLSLSLAILPGTLSDSLSMPYAEQGKVTWRARHANDNVDVSPWVVVVEDPEVAEVTSTAVQDGALAIELAMGRAGETSLRIWASSERRVLLREQRLRVATPDGVRFHAQSDVMTRTGWAQDDSEAPLHVASDGETQFRLVAYAGDEVVHATPLTVTVDQDATVSVSLDKGRLLDADANSLLVTGRGVGACALTVTSAGRSLLVTEVIAHAPSDVSDIAILHQRVDGEDDDGAVKHLFARGVLAGGTPVHGVRASWQQSAERLSGRGDMLEYRLDRNVTTEVTVRVGEQERVTTIQGTVSAVGTTGHAGCAHAGPSPWAWTAVLVVALRARIRRAVRVVPLRE